MIEVGDTPPAQPLYRLRVALCFRHFRLLVFFAFYSFGYEHRLVPFIS